MGNECKSKNALMGLRIADRPIKRDIVPQTRSRSTSEDGVRLYKSRRGLRHLPKGQTIDLIIVFDIAVIYDSEEKLWVGECDSLGIVAEANTFESLTQLVQDLVPDMIEVNNIELGSNKPYLNFSHLEEAAI